MRRWALPIGFFLLGLYLCLPPSLGAWRVYAAGYSLSIVGIVVVAVQIALGLGAIGFAGSRLIVNSAQVRSDEGDARTRSLIESVLRNFPGAPQIVGDETEGYEAVWTGEGLSAGIRTRPNRVTVFLGDAEAEVATAAQATDLLRGIFADEYVAVATYKDRALLKCYIAPAVDIGAGLNSATHVYQGPLATPADQLRIMSWSGALDADQA